MKFAHIAIVTPHRAGLYETVRDLVAAERGLGVDARIIDPQATSVDRGVPTGFQFNPAEYDCIINHSGIGAHLDRVKKSGKPVIHCMHGRPESSFRLEEMKKAPVYSFLKAASEDPMYRRFVTFWPEFVPYWSLVLPADKIRTVTAPVDLEAWTPNGPTGYRFNGRKGTINIVITDLWRDDVTPFHCIHAFCEFAARAPGSRLHIYGLHRHKALDVLLAAVQERGWLGEAAGMVEGLANVYRAATMLISPHWIATRAIREAMACGCPVMRGVVEVDPSLALPGPDDRAAARKFAEENYDSRRSAAEMIAIVEEVLK